MKHIIKELLQISRPRFWVYTWGSYAVGAAAGFENFQVLNGQSVLIVSSVVILTFVSNLFIFGINDYYDKDTDIHNIQKKTGYESNSVGVNQRLLITSIAAAFIILSMFTIYQPTNVSKGIMILSIISAIVYSSPPIRLKSKPFIDSLSNFLYVLPILLGYNHVSGDLPSVPVILALGAWSVAMHLFSAIPDIEPDRKASLRTTALILGEKKSLFICFLLWSFFSLMLVSTKTDLLTIFLFLYPLIPILLIFTWGDHLFKIYKLFPALNGLFGFSAFVYFVVQKLLR